MVGDGLATLFYDLASQTHSPKWYSRTIFCDSKVQLMLLCTWFTKLVSCIWGGDQVLLEYSEDYEKQIAQLKANISKIELAKTSVEEQMLAMTMEQVYSFNNMHILSSFLFLSLYIHQAFSSQCSNRISINANPIDFIVL